MKGIYALQPAGPCNREDAPGEALPAFRLAAKADFAPLHSEAQCTLRDVIGGLHAFMENKGEEMIPVFDGSLSTGRNGSILTRSVVQAPSFHAAPDEGGRLLQLFAGQDPFQKSMPAGEEPIDFLQHVMGERACIRAAADVLESLELPYEVSPTQLSEPVFVVRTIGGVIITGDDPREGCSQNQREHCCPAAFGNTEIGC